MKIKFDLEHSYINSKTFFLTDEKREYKVFIKFNETLVIHNDKLMNNTKRKLKIILAVHDYYFKNYDNIIKIIKNKE